MAFFSSIRFKLLGLPSGGGLLYLCVASFLPAFLGSLSFLYQLSKWDTSGCLWAFNCYFGSICPFLSCSWFNEVVNGGIVGVWTVWTPSPGVMWLYCPCIFLILSAFISYFLTVQSVNFSGVWDHVFLLYDDLTQSTHLCADQLCISWICTVHPLFLIVK